MVCFDYEAEKCSVCGRKTQDGFREVKGQMVCDECGQSRKSQPVGNPDVSGTVPCPAGGALGMEAKLSGVRALARIRYRGREYVLDDRLWELRPVDEPWAGISLQSKEAARIISKGVCVQKARYLH